MTLEQISSRKEQKKKKKAQSKPITFIFRENVRPIKGHN